MNEYDVKRLAIVLSIQAEIEGMKSDNKQREMDGHSLSYNDSDFCNKAEELRNTSAKHDHQF